MSPLGERLEPGLEEERIASVWQRIAAARRQPPRRRWIGVSVGLAVAAALLLFWLRPEPTAPPGALRVAEVPAASGLVWRLDDGSGVDLGAGTELEVLSNDGGHFVTKLARGRARFDVKPGGPRRWQVETSLATVEVIGTAFELEDQAGGLTVRVEHGVVLVRGERVPGRVVRLAAGEELLVRREPPPAPTVPERAETPAREPVAPPAFEARHEPPAREPVAPPAFEARHEPPAPNRHEPPAPTRREPERVEAAPQEPTPTPASSGPLSPTEAAEPPPAAIAPSFADALAEADTLRARGEPRAAAVRLERALAEHTGEAGAGVVAFSLGKLYLDKLGQPERAARAFARVLAEGRPRGLLADAHARRVEALLAAGQLEAARAALVAFERAFPGSPRARSLRTRLP